jgi:hypothetical protein
MPRFSPKVISMKRIFRLGLCVTLACLSLSATRTLADDGADEAKGVGELLSEVCLPILKDGKAESEAIHEARLIRIHRIWFPEPAPKGLRQYSAPYKSVSVVNLTDDSCSIHVNGHSYEALEAAVDRALSSRNEAWHKAPIFPLSAVQRAFCDPTNTVKVITYEGDPAKVPGMTHAASFEVRVTKQANACALKPAED